MILLFYKKDNGDGDDFTTPLKELISNERRNTKLCTGQQKSICSKGYKLCI